jgi:hypothetical protein
MAGAATAQAPPGGLTGEWVDSQANRFRLTQQGANLTIECPQCTYEDSDRIFEVPLKFTSALKDGVFEASQTVSGGTLKLTLKPAQSGMIRATVSFPAVATPFDLVLARSARFRASGKRPDHIAVQLIQPSASIGKWAPLEIHLEDRSGNLAAPEKPVLVELSASGGAPLPALARITADVPRVPAGILVTSPKGAIDARSPGLRAAGAVAIGCEQGEARRLKMSVTRTRALADGRDTVPVAITLVDLNDTPVSDGKPREIGFDVGGVARLAVQSGESAIKTVTVAAGQCAEARLIVADEAGEGSVSANFLERTQTRKLVFKPRFSALAMLLALSGGLIGGFVAAGRHYASVSRWKWRRWLYWFVGSLAGAAVVYLAYFYGLLQATSGFPSGAGFALLAGLLGGFLGASALEKLAGVALHP